ncbi:DAK2 domain-containing protein, partial [Microbacterium sp. K24]|uniref:DAK2 domain-containing protein n=1 Tax=Microbacterium sp. K24 TaxID=2305446 RepID=UPI00109CE16E
RDEVLRQASQRARAHGQHSVGTPDPGAHSLALIVTAVGDLFADLERNTHD